METGIDNNWVERRFTRDKKLNDLGLPWGDLCNAMSSAVRSFNKHYRSNLLEVEVTATNDNGHFQVIVPIREGQSSPVRIDVNINGRKIVAQYSNGAENQRCEIDADHVSVYFNFR